MAKGQHRSGEKPTHYDKPGKHAKNDEDEHQHSVNRLGMYLRCQYEEEEGPGKQYPSPTPINKHRKGI